jgi:hypothetical protein
MATRQVLRTRKDSNGEITHLCGAGFTISEADAIAEIEKRVNAYNVQVPGVGAVDVVVRQGRYRKYLTTDPDKTTTNNLAVLPDC